MIYVQPLKSLDIHFLQRSDTLYTCDFRAIGESFEYEIPIMRKYENLLPWIIHDQHIVINEWGTLLSFSTDNVSIILANHSDSRVSLYRRLQRDHFLKNQLSKVWVAIPHPDADQQGEKLSLELNYSYTNFLWRNDKIKQKELLKERTPQWKIIKDQNEIDDLATHEVNGFIKRRVGSGGFTVFDIVTLRNNEQFKKLFKENNQDWYFEELVHGKSHSIQCIKYGNSTDSIIFGLSEQVIEDKKNFTGSHILSLDNLSPQVLSDLKEGLENLSPLLENYEGFFGIDFIEESNGRAKILEANIRMTAVTIPTLLTNAASAQKAEYREDIPLSKINKDEIVLAIDKLSAVADTLRLV